MLPAHSSKAPSLRTLIWWVLSDVEVNPPFMVAAPALLVLNQSFPWAVPLPGLSGLAGWLRKRSKLQRGLRMRCLVTRMPSRRYSIFMPGNILQNRVKERYNSYLFMFLGIVRSNSSWYLSLFVFVFAFLARNCAYGLIICVDASLCRHLVVFLTCDKYRKNSHLFLLHLIKANL